MRSKEYWARRAEALERELQDEAGRMRDDIVSAYRRAIKDINGDIRKTFKAYVSTGIPEDEAKKLLNAADRDKTYAELMKLYRETDDPEIKQDIVNRINAQAYGARISRLEGVKNGIYVKLRLVGNNAQKLQQGLYTKVINAAYYTTVYNLAKGANAGVDSALLPHRAIDKLLRADWQGANYSKRIWTHNNRFIKAVQQTVETGIIAGDSVNQMAERLNNYVRDNSPDGIITSTTRLVRTETSHFMNQGQLTAYEDIGIKKYRFMAALSERTCDTCAGLDGEEFDVADAKEGENFPPIHPNCRCTTVTADAELTSRWARNPETGKDYRVDGDMTFEQWKDSFTPKQKAAFDMHVKQLKNKSSDMKQYQKYIDALGKKNVPGTFDKWQDLKYNKTEENVGRYESVKLAYADKSLQNRIRETYNLTIHEGKQGKHIIGHNNYIEGRSYLTVSIDEAQELVNKYAGTGLINRSQTTKKWLKTETVTVDRVIGVDIDNRNGVNTDTNTFKIHYSKKGTHIVPQKR